MWKKLSLLILSALLVGGVSIQPALGQKYPTKPIELYLPYGPGGGYDLISRAVAKMAPKYLEQPIVVVNKPGGGGSIAAADVISSKPDGYKLMFTTSGFFALTTKTQKVPFDPNHLVPLACFCKNKGVMVVRNDSPWKTVDDVLDYARKNPGKLTWAHSGRGIAEHIWALLLFRKAGVKTIDVPYPAGEPEKIPALLGGHVDVAFSSGSGIKGHLKAGTIRVLVAMSDRRYEDLPNVPCTQELGFTESAKIAVVGGWFAHKDTPDDIKKTLIDALKKVYEDPELKKIVDDIGEQPFFGGPELIYEKIKYTEELGVPILKELGLYVEK